MCKNWYICRFLKTGIIIFRFFKTGIYSDFEKLVYIQILKNSVMQCGRNKRGMRKQKPLSTLPTRDSVAHCSSNKVFFVLLWFSRNRIRYTLPFLLFYRNQRKPQMKKKRCCNEMNRRGKANDGR